MKENNKEIKTKWLHVRLSEKEYAQLQTNFRTTTVRKLSTYARNILLEKPMIKGVRNLTTDNMLQQFAQLLKDLNGIANNYNQAIHKLHTLQRSDQYMTWLVTYEMDKRRMIEDINAIRQFINENAAKWLQ